MGGTCRPTMPERNEKCAQNFSLRSRWKRSLGKHSCRSRREDNIKRTIAQSVKRRATGSISEAFGLGSREGQNNFLSSTTSRQTLGFTQPSI
jgi:hypothetical protein